MNTDYAKELLAQYKDAFLGDEQKEFRGFTGSQRYSYAAGAFYQMTKMLVEEMDRKAKK